MSPTFRERRRVVRLCAVRRVEKAGRIGTVGAKKQIGNTHGEKTGAARAAR